MLSKKPFAGMACASCEKDMTNMHGRRVEYIPFSKLPTRDPQQRMIKVGQGFSKILSMMQPENTLEHGRKTPSNFPTVSRESFDPRIVRRISTTNTNKRQVSLN